MDIPFLMVQFNEWWKTGHVRKEFAKETHRPLFTDIEKYLPDRQIIGITGLRRTGKTTVMYQFIEHLINSSVNPKNILYFTIGSNDHHFKTTSLIPPTPPAIHLTQIHALVLQFIHQQPEHIIHLPHPVSPGNHPFYLCPHLDIQQHLVNAPALTEPGPEAEAGGCFHIVHGT